MKPITLLKTLGLGVLLAAVPSFVSAQTVIVDPARKAGEHEFTLGGGGASNKDFDDSLGGVNFSYGWYTSDTQAWVIRQSINYSNPNIGGKAWNGSTRLAFDQHLTARGAFRPFVGVNVGGVYGDAVRDSFAAGLEGGVKYYVQPKTFVFGMAEYGWLFREARSIDDRFDDGQFNWTVGIGFNF